MGEGSLNLEIDDAGGRADIGDEGNVGCDVETGLEPPLFGEGFVASCGSSIGDVMAVDCDGEIGPDTPAVVGRAMGLRDVGEAG